MWLLSFVRKQVADAPLKPIGRATFIKYKIGIWTYFAVWFGLGLFLLVNWSSLGPLISWPLAAVEGLFAPDTSIFRRMFERFESFAKRVTGGDF